MDKLVQLHNKDESKNYFPLTKVEAVEDANGNSLVELLGDKIELDFDDFTQIVKLTDGTETLAELKARLDEINEDGKHVFFDTSALNEDMYLCTIFIDGTSKYRVTDAVTGKSAIGDYVATKTLSQVLSEAVEDLVTITVTCTTQDGVTVTGQTVTLRNGTSHESPVLATKAYEGQPVSFVVAKDTTYFVEVTSTLAGHFNPTTASGAATTNTSVILTYSDVAHLSTFNDIKVAVNAGVGNAIVGVEIDDDWTATDGTVYSNPMVVVDVATVQDADGNEHVAAIMQRKYASLDAIQFDEAEQILATGNYEASLYYYTQNTDGTYKLLVAGTDYQIGDAIVGTVYKNAIRDTTGNIIRYGYNRYRDSAYRQYLNSDAGVGNWWESTHIGDKAPAQLNSVKGYKAGCSADLLAYAKPVRQNCYTNSVTDSSEVDVLCDLFWLLSVRQMAATGNDNEGTRWKYWVDKVASFADYTADTGRITYAVENHQTAVDVRVRSAHRSYSYVAWRVSSDGGATSDTAATSCRCAPACAIY